ncbi:MAG: superoxide dismutase family protein [Alphaproteobacteria bacterium]|nr:superoxide dismutase family protein [Alphaproteobacteria bacterium]
MKMFGLALGAALLVAGSVNAAQMTVTMNAVNADGVGAMVGTLKLRDTKHGLFIQPLVGGLTPGAHGFHVHENNNCGNTAPDGAKGAGLAAGGHYDPKGTKMHHGPHDKAGHLGDLPVLVADGNGNATVPVLAPNLTVSQVKGRAIVIHAGGDNYSDQPAALGGGGARVACGTTK